MGRVQDTQGELFITPSDLARTAKIFDLLVELMLAQKLLQLLVEEKLFAHGSRGGRPLLPPYFRMNFIGYFEEITSYRRIAWRCADSMALHRFLNIPLTVSTPDHSTLSHLRRRLPQAVREELMRILLVIVN